METFYANKISANFDDYEIILDCTLAGSEGCRLILPYEVAAKLAALLQTGIKESEPVKEVDE